MEDNPHKGHRERLRNEFLKNGINQNTPQHKVLEFLLFYSIPRIDTNKLAHDLLKKFHTIGNVFDASEEELLSVKGIGQNTVTLIKSIVPIAKFYMDDKSIAGTILENSDEIGNYIFKKYIGFTDETLTLLSLNNRGKVLGFDILGHGDINSVGVSTRKVMECVMRSKATACVLAHNHPSGIAIPSDEDIEITKALKSMLFGIGVRLVDHIIIVNDDFVSLKSSMNYKKIFD